MENNKKESLKDVMDSFIFKKLEKFKKEREEKENRFSEEIGEIHEFGNLCDVVEDEIEEVHKLEIDLEEMNEQEEDDIEKLVKDIAEEITPIDDIIQIPCKINNVERTLVNGVNCNIKPIPLLNVALITNLNISIIDVELNDYMMSIMDIILLIVLKIEQGQSMIIKSDVNTLYKLGLITAVDSLLAEVELSPIEFRGITTLSSMDEYEQILKYLNNIE
jgi:hypothetical protein